MIDARSETPPPPLDRHEGSLSKNPLFAVGGKMSLPPSADPSSHASAGRDRPKSHRRLRTTRPFRSRKRRAYRDKTRACLGRERQDWDRARSPPSPETVARALATLTPPDLVRLERLAQLRTHLQPGLEWGAVARSPTSDRAQFPEGRFNSLFGRFKSLFGRFNSLFGRLGNLLSEVMQNKALQTPITSRNGLKSGYSL